MDQDRSDMELIQSYLSGDAASFDMLYGRYKNQLYSYLNRLLNGERACADDIFQQTWLNIIRKLSSYKDSERFLAWAMRIAHNQAIDFYRKRSRKAEDALDEDFQTNALYDTTAESPGDELEQTELHQAIETAVQELPSEMKQVFLLRQEDVSFREIAKIQNCSINTCLARMQYALKKLRVQLKDWVSDGGNKI